MKDKLFSVLQRVGRSFMLPIAILPVAGLFLGIGGSFTNETMLKTYGLLNIMGPGTVIYSILSVLNAAGNIVFANLPIIFAIGVAIGMAKKEKDVSALAAAIAFFIMHASISALIEINGGTDSMLDGATASVLGITSLQMGVFGGIIVGLGVAALHNRFHKIELPQVLSFFGGSRFIPIISSITYLIVGIAMFYIWPPVQTSIYQVGNIVLQSGYAGTWVYGLMERLLIPFGLHHVFYLPFWQTAVGGTATVSGELIEGAQNIFFAQLASSDISHFSVDATRFMSGKFPLMIFGLPGAALAMYKTAKPEKRKLVGGLLLSAALTSMLTGITEPIEFTFLFVAPALYGIHCAFAGLAYMFMHMLNVGVGMTFSGGAIDLFLFGILQGNDKTSWLNIIWVGILYFVVYYFLFSFLIKKFNLKTPGREEGNDDTKLYTRTDVNERKNKTIKDELSVMISKGLGGFENISDVDCCATRLRTTVFNSELVNEDILKSTGALGVIKKGQGIQIIYGPKVNVIKSNLEDYLQNPSKKLENSNYNTTIKNTATKDITKSTSKKLNKILSPLKGKVSPLKELNDGVFSEEMLGKGIYIKPEDGQIFSPFDGKVSMVFDTKHAISLLSEDGVEILIHIGIDTVRLNGKHFDVKVKTGDTIKTGDLLLNFDIKAIENEGYKTYTPIVISNTDSFHEIHTIEKSNVDIKDTIIEIN